MNKPIDPHLLVGNDAAEARQRWEREYRAGISENAGKARDVTNVSGIPIQPLYTRADVSSTELGYPGQPHPQITTPV